MFHSWWCSLSNQESANLHFPISASVSQHVEGVTSPNHVGQKIDDITCTRPRPISRIEHAIVLMENKYIHAYFLGVKLFRQSLNKM